jgi:LCP family protein required for cell wall assembly
MSRNYSNKKRRYSPRSRAARRRKRSIGCFSCLLPVLLVGLVILLFAAAYLFFPQRSNILLLGVDYTDPTNAVGRTDTIILSTFILPEGYVGMLSIPRDLWVTIPGVGNNRINTAHFFAEALQAGSGPIAAINTVEQNFGVDIDYFLRIRFQGFRDVVDAMGGLDLDLERPMAGYAAGEHHLTGRKALAFTRNRLGSDDFFRMERGQIVLKAMFKQMLNPIKWIRLPSVIVAFVESVDTNIPAYLWPRFGFSLLRVGVDGIDNRTITREMVTPFITDYGANILLPRWDLINPVLYEMFEQ